MEDYPEIEPQDIQAAILYASERIENEKVFVFARQWLTGKNPVLRRLNCLTWSIEKALKLWSDPHGVAMGYCNAGVVLEKVLHDPEALGIVIQ